MPDAVPDLRSFLASVPEAILRIDGGVSTAHEVTALQYRLRALGRFPVIRVSGPVLPGGGRSTFDLVCNLTASRRLTVAALGIADHSMAAVAYAERTARGIAPVMVAAAEAPVQQVVHRGDAADLTTLPAVRQHSLDPGHYLTAAHATTWDPDTEIDNTAIQRCWIKGPWRMSYFPYPASHNARNMRKFWARGEPCPIAFWIGHHPAVLMGTQAKLGYPESHWGATGGLLGAPLRLVPSVTHGARLPVPADAEIVIEGWVPADVLEADGPFGEYTGYAGPQVSAPVCEVTCITHRRDAIYHDYGSGLEDMLVPDNMVMEGKLFAMTKAVAPSVVNVHVPVSGRRFHAYLQLRRPAAGEARDALMAALSYRRTKTAIVVDDDIDLFSDTEVMWALATRVQWHRDCVTLTGMSGSLLDPSLPAQAVTTSKCGIDATLAPAPDGDAPHPVPPRSVVPQAALDKAAALLAGADVSGWPPA